MVIKALDPDWIRIRIGVHPKMLDPDPDEMNTDPQPWFSVDLVDLLLCSVSDPFLLIPDQDPAF